MSKFLRRRFSSEKTKFNIACIICVLVALLFSLPALQSTATMPVDDPVISQVLYAVNKHYLDSERIVPLRMLESSLRRVELLIPEFLVQYQDQKRAALITVGSAQRRFALSSGSLDQLAKTLNDILNFTYAHYHGKTKQEDIRASALDGLLEALDPHSNFFSPKVFKEFKVGTKGSFGGLGIVVGMREGKLTVISALEDTPAFRAGIKPNDHIVQIDEFSTISMSLNDAVDHMRGDVNSKVKVIIERGNQVKPLAFTLTRALINIQSVQATNISTPGKNIGYIKIKNFQSNTDRDVTAALKNLQKTKTLDGLILDLRNNPGGLLDQSVHVVDHFLREGVIVSTVAAHNELLEAESAEVAGTDPDYPIIVLINEGSASAAEIVSGALQAHDRAVVVGTRSFGKGSVQTIMELGMSNAMKLTIAEYRAAGKLSLQLSGVTPDIHLLPYTIDKKQLNLVEDQFATEGDLEQHLDNKKQAEEKSSFEVAYINPPEPEEENNDAALKKEYNKVPQVEDDFAVQFAKRLLVQAQHSKRPDFLLQAKNMINTIKQEQDKLIEQAFAGIGINWTAAAKTEKPQLHVSYALKKGNNLIPSLLAGEEGSLEMTVKNVGKTPIARLTAAGTSDLSFLNNREFVFGELKPGESKSWSTTIAPQEFLSTQDAVMKAQLYAGTQKLEQEIEVTVPVRELAQPKFAVSYSLKNGNATDLKAGKSTSLNIDIHNLGSGETTAEAIAVLSLDDDDSLFMEKGRAVFGKILPRQKTPADFSFHLDPKMPVKNVKLDLAIFDPKRNAQLDQDLTLDIEHAALQPSSGELYQAPDIHVENISSHSTQSTAWNLKAVITDDRQVHDVVVFVGDKKIYYATNPQQSATMPLNISIPLEEGSNTIVIASRDELNLMQRETLVIRRLSATRKLAAQ